MLQSLLSLMLLTQIHGVECMLLNLAIGLSEVQEREHGLSVRSHVPAGDGSIIGNHGGFNEEDRCFGS